jgi:hypothetical protein
MDRDYLFESQFAAAPMPAPHFDDERTLRAARRVVPLEQVAIVSKASKTSYRRQLVVGAAFAVAILLGAGVALLSVYVRHINSETSTGAAVEIDEPQPLETATQPSSTVGEGQEVSASSHVVAGKTDEQTNASLAAKGRRAEDRPSRTMSQSVKTVPRGEPDDSNERDDSFDPGDDGTRNDRKPVLVEQWEERRSRREMRRERRGRDAYPNRDLFRIDEIFQGSRRPE